MRYLSHTEADIQYMLTTINLNNIEDLFQSIPKNLRLKKKMRLPIELDEFTIKKID